MAGGRQRALLQRTRLQASRAEGTGMVVEAAWLGYNQAGGETVRRQCGNSQRCEAGKGYRKGGG